MRVRAREISVSSDSQSASEEEMNEDRGRSSRKERAGRRSHRDDPRNSSLCSRSPVIRSRSPLRSRSPRRSRFTFRSHSPGRTASSLGDEQVEEFLPVREREPGSDPGEGTSRAFVRRESDRGATNRVSKDDSKRIRKLLACGISRTLVKEIKEDFDPYFGHSSFELRCPELDDSMLWRIRREHPVERAAMEAKEKALLLSQRRKY